METSTSIHLPSIFLTQSLNIIDYAKIDFKNGSQISKFKVEYDKNACFPFDNLK
jgi:hypothetical protein